jgi:hypothetical protein
MLKIISVGWKNKLIEFQKTVSERTELEFFELIKNTRLAMNSRIEDYPAKTGDILQQTLMSYGIEPEKGQLRRALEESMDKGTVLRNQNSNIFKQDTINIAKLNTLTLWGGVGGKRPIQTPNKWRTNPYPESGFWKVYNDGFDWGDVRIIGRNYIGLGNIHLEKNFNLTIRKIINVALTTTFFDL